MNFVGKSLRAVAILALMVFAAFPVYWMFNTALSNDTELYKTGEGLWPNLERLGEFPRLLSEVPILSWLGNSFVVAAGTTILSLLLGVAGAYALSRFKFYGKGLAGFILFATQMLPEALLVVPLYALFSSLGILNNLGGLVLTDTAFAMPVAVFVIKGAIDKVPFEIEESARVDGCSRVGVITMVVFPLIVPSVAAASVIAFFAAWNEFLFANTFISSSDLWPAPVGLASFLGQYFTPINLVMVSALAFALPAIVFFMWAQRSIVSGLTAGAVKG